MSYLIDTDWVIDYLSGRPPAIQVIESLIPAVVSVSVVTFVEVYEGVLFGRDPQRFGEAFSRFMEAATVIEVNEDVARVCARVRGSLRREGRPVPMADLLIASTALHHNLTLVTRNRRHFERVSGLRLLHDINRE